MRGQELLRGRGHSRVRSPAAAAASDRRHPAFCRRGQARRRRASRQRAGGWVRARGRMPLSRRGTRYADRIARGQSRPAARGGRDAASAAARRFRCGAFHDARREAARRRSGRDGRFRRFDRRERRSRRGRRVREPGRRSGPGPTTHGDPTSTRRYPGGLRAPPASGT